MGKISDIEKYASVITANSTKCKCGHTVTIPPQLDKVLCSWCGKYVFKSAEVEFKYRMFEQMNKRRLSDEGTGN